MEKSIGPINSIVLARSAESDKIYKTDEESIEANGLCELMISENQFMNFNDRDTYLPELAEKLFGVEYYLNDFVSTGIMYYDLMDMYNVKIGDNIYNCLMLNDEQLITQGLEENIYTDRPETSETDYSKADKTDQRINQAYLIVNKQNQTIQAVTETTSTIEKNTNNKIQELIQQLDGYATEDDLIQLTERVETTQDNAQLAIDITKEIQANGVDKIITKTGYTFDDEGLTIEKTGSKVKSKLDEARIRNNRCNRSIK